MRFTLYSFLLTCSTAFHFPRFITRQHCLHSTTYVPIDIGNEEAITTLLVKSDQHEIISNLKKMSESSAIDQTQLERWKSEGVVFPLDSEGTHSLMASERKELEANSVVKRKDRLRHNVDVYLNISPKKKSPQLIKASSARDYVNGRKDFQTLEQTGAGFSNMSDLFVDYSVLSRADHIATRISTEFPIGSPEWQRYTNKTMLYNATSLTQVCTFSIAIFITHDAQVISEYFTEHSIGDVGGAGANYIPRRGYPGTLAPGEMFAENEPYQDLEKRVLHPWPALQEFQFHVRMPPNHPLLPPPLLWFGLNNMFTENFTDSLLSMPSNETVGGMSMSAKDAVRIAKYHNIGMCYDPAVQVKHGGMIFKTGRIIPHYNPDHGPTYDPEEAKPPVPPELVPVTERWLHPHFGLVSTTFDEPLVTPAQKAEMDEEEAMRQVAAERLLALLPGAMDREAYEAEEKRLDEEDLEMRKLMKAQRQKAALQLSNDDENEEAQERVQEPEPLQFDRPTRRMQQKVAKGYARDPCTLITYTIETIREMDEEVAAAEKDLASKKKYSTCMIYLRFVNVSLGPVGEGSVRTKLR